ncbi:hypothetical protein LEP1GSC163_0920 [Leptospira santarosai str. CBC379]|uniref:Uncharacterized protein n=1 Tax=Leptospira santarosai str. MOR084 TaxID=1049984 RepID=A0A0E2BBZ2_9LEPT|nr:hypothetical protein [Leptospira santarosai]EKO32758.1 hypothetical protein LEP1GSC179_3019 [Leptospira santarosai str. MOR084]EKR93380.1 hypothetical protein LEP1GSC163_0920 [Leptospira santarosai str. CBC379]
MKLDQFSKWIPIVGIYFIKNSNDSIWKKAYWIFGNILLSILLLGVVTSPNNKTAKNTTTETLPQKELKSEVEETQNADFVAAVKRLGNGTGKEWNSASDGEKFAACLIMSKALLKRLDNKHATRLCQQLEVFYQDQRMENQEVATIASVLSRVIQK